jgi:hypothetical protein
MSSWRMQWIFGLHRRQKISCVADWLIISQDWLRWLYKQFLNRSGKKNYYTQYKINICQEQKWCWARIAQWYSARLRAGWSEVRVPTGIENFCLHHRVLTGSESHPASYPMTNRGSFSAVKRPSHSPPPSFEVKQWVGLYLHSPNTPAWRGGAQL